jgi:hypothetical protein
MSDEVKMICPYTSSLVISPNVNAAAPKAE